MSKLPSVVDDRPAAEALAAALVVAAAKAGAAAADATVGLSASLSASARDGSLDELTRSQSRAAAVRVIVDGRVGFATSSDATQSADEIDELVLSSLPQTSLFAARFRECAARALLLPRRRPDRRTPLWQQRQRAADLLAVAAKYPTFPILLETSRECVQDVFDLPALRDVLGQLRSRTVRVVSVDTAKASPFAQSLLFN